MPRRSRDETRRLLIDRGADMLLERGFVGGGHIRLMDVCAEVEQRTGQKITSGSVYERIWRDQRDFQLDVLAELLGRYDMKEIERAFQEGEAALAEADLTTRAGREAAKAEFCRRTANALVQELLGSRFWQIWVAVWGAVGSTHELTDDFRIGAVIEKGYGELTLAFAERTGAALTSLGYRLRPGLTSYQLATALGALTEGLTLRLRYDRDHTEELTTHSADGHPQPWGLVGLGFEALVDRFYQPGRPHQGNRPET